MYYWTPDGRQVLDGIAGLWCVNAGHGRKRDHRGGGEADRGDGLRAAVPDGPSDRIRARERAGRRSRPRASTTCSSRTRARSRWTRRSRSRSPTTACAAKAARTRLIGRERGYHGVGFGGISVGGMVNNRKYFGAMLPGVDHLRHTHDPARNALLARPARARRGARRRPRAAGRAARRLDHRRASSSSRSRARPACCCRRRAT